MRAQASLGSGADMLAVKVRGWRGVRETCRRRRWRMQLGHEVVDDEKMVVGQSRLPTAPNRQANLRIAVSRWLDPFATIFSVICASLETFHQCRIHRSNVLAGLTSHLRWWLTRVVAVSPRIDHPINVICRPVLSTAVHKLPISIRFRSCPSGGGSSLLVQCRRFVIPDCFFHSRLIDLRPSRGPFQGCDAGGTTISHTGGTFARCYSSNSTTL